MVENTLVDRISKNFNNIKKRNHVKNMESESVSISWLIQIPTIGTIPDSDVTVKLSGDKLSETAKRSHSFRAFEPKDQVFSGINLNIFQIFDLLFLDDVPNGSIKHIKITEDFTIAEHSCDSVVTNCNVRFVAT